MPALVYTLCFITSALCAVLLVRAYFKNRAKLLLWSALSFALLATNNLFVVFDLVIFPDLYLLPYRWVTALAAVAVLIYGFIWEAE